MALRALSRGRASGRGAGRILVVLTVALAIGLSHHTDSGAVGAGTPSVNSRAQGTDETRVSAPDCLSARRAVRFYGSRYVQHVTKMGAPKVTLHRGSRCPHYLARVLRAKALAARKAYARWLEYHYHWQAWLPDKFARVGACETGYGRRPGSWTWDSGTYVSAFGIYRPAYAQFARATGTPTWDESGARTPREQYIVASAIQARFGWGAWGCGGA